jgi:hypothetical protein
MSIKVTVTEDEILSTPNDNELGKLTRSKYWQARRDSEGPQFDDEHFSLTIDEEGLVASINKPWTCSICNKDTSEIDYDYLVGYDHLKCVLEGQTQYDKCVICGKESPYTISTHIDLREGYVEGGGQGCFQPNKCENE